MNCSICLNEIKRGEEKYELRCGHVFHTGCIFKNALLGSTNCPNCRISCLEDSYDSDTVEDNRVRTIEEANRIQIDGIVRRTLQKIKNKTILPQHILKAVKAYEVAKLKLSRQADKHQKNRKLRAALDSQLKQIEKRFKTKEKKLQQEKKKALQNTRAKFREKNGRIPIPPSASVFEMKRKRTIARKKRKIAVLSGFLPREAY
jgi:predicted  nucleic acid-binding Zn-ribbon protein